MSQKLQRRTFLKGSLAASTAIALPMQAMAQEVLKMGHFDEEGRVRNLLGGLFCAE